MVHATFSTQFFHQTFSRMNTRLQPCFVLATFLACLCFQSQKAAAQSDPTIFEGDLWLTTQAEVNAFNYREVTGELRIGPSTADAIDRPVDLTPLLVLTKVNRLFIQSARLDNLNGLDSLKEAQDITLVDSGIKSIRALGGLQVLGQLYIGGEPLTSLDGLQQLQRMGGLSVIATDIEDLLPIEDIEFFGGDLFIFENKNLASCCIIPSLQERVQGEVTIVNNAPGCTSLTDIYIACGVTPTNCQDDIILATQKAVDAFQCTSVNSLVIDLRTEQNNDPITDLSPLQSLTNVEDSLSINLRNRTIDLSGFLSLERVGNEFTIREGQLSNFEAFGNLTEIGGTLSLVNGRLDNFEGAQLQSVGAITVSGADLGSFKGLGALKKFKFGLSVANTGRLKNFVGLENVISIGSLLVNSSSVVNFKGLSGLETVDLLSISSNTITSLTGLESLKKITGYLFISPSRNISNLQGLNGLEEIDGFIWLENTGLTSLEGLDNLRLVKRGANIKTNRNLSDCCVLLRLAPIIQGDIELADNAPGCDDLEEVTSSCQDGEIWLEAECATTIGSAWRIVQDPVSSGQQYLKAKSDQRYIRRASDDPETYFTFKFVTQAGEYNLFSRHLSYDGFDDSFWVRVNGGEWVLAYLGAKRGSFVWAQTGGRKTAFTLSAGTNTITIALREPNAKLDKLFLTLEGNTPLGLGEPAINCGDQNVASTDVWLEAECATEIGPTWRLRTDPTASQTNYLQASEILKNFGGTTFDPDKITFRFQVSEAGRYRIFTRHLSYNGNDDSFWVQINGGPLIQAYLGANRGSFTWAELGVSTTYPLQAGSNTITVLLRESNARFDKMFVTLNGNKPSGVGETAVNCQNSSRVTAVSYDRSSAEGEVLDLSSSLHAYPVPADRSLSVHFADESEPGDLVLTDLSGKEIRHLAFPNGSGRKQVEIETQDIPAGVYLLQWRGAHPYREKLLIAH